MRMIRRSLEALAVVAVLAFQAMPSQAQPFDQTFVRSDGGAATSCENLANRCSPLALGIQNVNPGGTVNVMDGNVHVSVAIDKSLTILSVGNDNVIEGAGTGSPSSGIHINMPSGNDILTIRGISIDERSANVHGITFIGAGTLHLQDCFIRGSANGFGINFIPTGTSELHISNCVIADNATNGLTGGGILIKPSGGGSVKVVLENVDIENSRLGILVDGTANSIPIFIDLRDSKISGNSTFGIGAFEGGGGTTTIMVEGTTSAANATHGIFASGSGAVVRVRDSVMSGNAAGVSAASSGQIVSHGDNVVAGNTTNGAFTSTLPPQ